MQRISTVLEAWLVAQGMSAGSVGAGRANRAADAGGDRTGQAQRGEEETRAPMGMGMGLEKDAGRNRRQFTGRRQTEGETTLMVAIATMKGARVVRTAPLMLIMDGGKS